MTNNVLRQKLTRPIAAFVCCFLLLTASVGQIAHALSAHRDEDKPHCQAEPGTAHLHTPDYGHHPCALCDFRLAPAAGFGIFDWRLPLQTPDFKAIPDGYCSPVGIFTLTLPDLRGPPTLER
jgi:hypothetical protein